jgi:hypothetical protein
VTRVPRTINEPIHALHRTSAPDANLRAPENPPGAVPLPRRSGPPSDRSIEAWGEDSEVIFELTPRGADVIMVLTYRRLADRDALVSVASGWHMQVGLLIDILNGSRTVGFWSTHAVEG